MSARAIPGSTTRRLIDFSATADPDTSGSAGVFDASVTSWQLDAVLTLRVREQGAAGTLELRLLGASHHVVASAGAARCPEVVACGTTAAVLKPVSFQREGEPVS